MRKLLGELYVWTDWKIDDRIVETYGRRKILPLCYKAYADTLIDDKGQIMTYSMKAYNLDNINVGKILSRSL